jgi:hypothetical protein
MLNDRIVTTISNKLPIKTFTIYTLLVLGNIILSEHKDFLRILIFFLILLNWIHILTVYNISREEIIGKSVVIVTILFSICIKVLIVIIDCNINYNLQTFEIIISFMLLNVYAFWDILYITIILLYLSSTKYAIKETLDKGLKHSEIVQFETKYENKSCSICLEDITNTNTIRKTECDHIFHDACITDWFNIQNSCPDCRFEFV